MLIKESAKWNDWMENVAPFLSKKKREFWEGKLQDAGMFKSDEELANQAREALGDISRKNDVEVHDISEVRPGGELFGERFGNINPDMLEAMLMANPLPYMTFPKKHRGRYFDTVDKVLREEAAKADAAAAVNEGRASKWKPSRRKVESPETAARQSAEKARYMEKVRTAYDGFRAQGMDRRQAYAEAVKSVDGGLKGVLTSMAEAPSTRSPSYGAPSPFGGSLVITDRDGLTYAGGPMKGVRKLVDFKIDPLFGKGEHYGDLRDATFALHEGLEGVAYREKARELENAVRKAIVDGKVDHSKVEDILTENFKRSQEGSAEFAMKQLADRGDLEDILKFVPREQLERYLAENFADRMLHDKDAFTLGLGKFLEQERAKSKSIDLLGELAEKSRELQRLKAGGSLVDRARAGIGGLLRRGGQGVDDRIAELERYFGDFNGKSYWDADPERFAGRYRLSLPKKWIDDYVLGLKGNSKYDAYFSDPAQATMMVRRHILPSQYVPVGSHHKKDVLERERRFVRRHMPSTSKVRQALEGVREGAEADMYLGGK